MNTAGGFAVLSVLMEEGTHHDALDAIWDDLPRKKGETIHLEHVEVEIDALLPSDRSTYRYRGSLTTPPRTEGVAWLVARTPIELSREQIDQFRSIIPKNNRPIQPLNGRRLTVGGVVDVP